MSARARSFLIFIIQIAVIVGAFAYLYVSGRFDFSHLAFAEDAAFWIAMAGLCSLVYVVLSQVRFWMLLYAVGVRVSILKVCQVGLIALSVNSLVAGGLGAISGDAIRMGFLMRKAPRPAAIVAATLMDRVLGSIVLVSVAVIALSVLLASGDIGGVSEALPIFYVGLCALLVLWAVASLSVIRGMRASAILWALLAIVSGVALVFFTHAPIPIIAGCLLASSAAIGLPALLPGHPLRERLHRGVRVRRFIFSLVDVIAEYTRRPVSLLGAIVLTLFLQLAAVATLYYSARIIQASSEPTMLQTLAAGSPALATSLLPLPANGLGVGEAAYDTTLRLISSPDGAPLVGGAAIYLAFRAVMFVVTLIGLPALPFYRLKDSSEDPAPAPRPPD